MTEPRTEAGRALLAWGGPQYSASILGIEAEAATPPALDPVKCAICNDYSAAGVEVHEACLAATPALDREALALEVLQVRDFLHLHRLGTGHDRVSIRKVIALLDAALSTGDET